jgi:DNA-binding CsgD family transcriptional regulator
MVLKQGVGLQGAVSNRSDGAADYDFDSEFEQRLGLIDARPRIVIDRDRQVLWRSDNAEKLLAPPVPLHLSGGQLTTDAVSTSSALADFIDGIGGDCDSMLLRGESRKHWAMLLAWSPRDRPEDVCLLLNLSVPLRGVEDSGLARALKLTAAETRVLDRFARLNTPREIASKMGISLSTVRSHLKQIHSKAGVESAVQLTQLVRGSCSC